ncbi:expressed unknown protein [Seminavis robusta]|uniref:Uncharacterized protein n=1 Tax=Seminavis robusta TaxID=568900 RepID=A0A9N8HVF2_9STRA|nr:expressed unknown protein [Seminavis robusta]|eukprot:Sro1497_g277620.1 n/a (317) ;mRNA; r:17159-18109
MPEEAPHHQPSKEPSLERVRQAFQRKGGYGSKTCRQTLALCLELCQKGRATQNSEGEESDYSTAVANILERLSPELTQQIIAIAYPLPNFLKDPFCPGLYVGVFYSSLFFLTIAVGPPEEGSSSRVAKLYSRDNPKHLQWNDNPGHHYTDHLWPHHDAEAYQYNPNKKLKDPKNKKYFQKGLPGGCRYRRSSDQSPFFRLSMATAEDDNHHHTRTPRRRQDLTFVDTLHKVPHLCGVRGFITHCLGRHDSKRMGYSKYVYGDKPIHYKVKGYAEHNPSVSLNHGVSEWSIVLDLGFNDTVGGPKSNARFYLVEPRL